jgi:hypothetical protein
MSAHSDSGIRRVDSGEGAVAVLHVQEAGWDAVLTAMVRRQRAHLVLGKIRRVIAGLPVNKRRKRQGPSWVAWSRSVVQSKLNPQQSHQGCRGPKKEETMGGAHPNDVVVAGESHPLGKNAMFRNYLSTWFYFPF